MKKLTLTITLLFCYSQVVLWAGDGGLGAFIKLKNKIEVLQEENTNLFKRNEFLSAQVVDLKQGLGAIEELARSEYGLIKKDEIFYQAIRS